MTRSARWKAAIALALIFGLGAALPILLPEPERTASARAQSGPDVADDAAAAQPFVAN